MRRVWIERSTRQYENPHPSFCVLPGCYYISLGRRLW